MGERKVIVAANALLRECKYRLNSASDALDPRANSVARAYEADAARALSAKISTYLKDGR